uniref:RING-type domain-containing protein n=1 Tax=Cyprinus carpio TaxID=7962 RepID=A0A8C1W166_CYPCA
MAEARISQDEFMCPVCLDLLKDPVTIQCGHSYCKSCIEGSWDQEDQMRVYSCPQCRQTFSPRPALARNTMLVELVEKLKKTRLSDDCDFHFYNTYTCSVKQALIFIHSCTIVVNDQSSLLEFEATAISYQFHFYCIHLFT